MANQDSAFSFPCQFPIKVIGKNTDDFVSNMVAIAKKYDDTITLDSVRSTLSKNNAFCSLHFNIHATSQSQLDALYTELSKHPDTNMVL